VLAGYLREKSYEMQMFITTHSTEFVDSVSFQNVFLVSRDDYKSHDHQGQSKRMRGNQHPSRAWPSPQHTVMYDKLIFVEGPSDEAVLREFAKKLQIDLTKRTSDLFTWQELEILHTLQRNPRWNCSQGVGFRCGLLLTETKTPMRKSRECERLGGRARLEVLSKTRNRKLSFGSHPHFRVLGRKTESRGMNVPRPTDDEVERISNAEVAKLKDEVVRLRTKSGS